jgi:ubiquinone/menaquinone biosynthesis C-methylase UbiE
MERFSMSDEDMQLHETFDKVADLYDKIRPNYPEELTADIMSISKIPPRGRILEVGCGTGQSTLPFACSGYRIDDGVGELPS